MNVSSLTLYLGEGVIWLCLMLVVIPKLNKIIQLLEAKNK